MHPEDLTPLQPADPQQGWPRVEARPDFGGLALLASLSAQETPTTTVGLSRAGWVTLVRLYARRYPARFAALAKEEMCAAWRGALEAEEEP